MLTSSVAVGALALFCLPSGWASRIAVRCSTDPLPTCPLCPFSFPQVARTLMVTHIPKEITDPSLIIKHFQ